MQNKPNFKIGKMNAKSLVTMDYENTTDWTLGENKPNSKPNKPNFRKAQMNVTLLVTKDYENQPLRRLPENKPNQTQFVFFAAAVKAELFAFLVGPSLLNIWFPSHLYHRRSCSDQQTILPSTVVKYRLPPAPAKLSYTGPAPLGADLRRTGCTGIDTNESGPFDCAQDNLWRSKIRLWRAGCAHPPGADFRQASAHLEVAPHRLTGSST